MKKLANRPNVLFTALASFRHFEYESFGCLFEMVSHRGIFEWDDLASKALTPNVVCNKPKIQTSRHAETVTATEQQKVAKGNLNKSKCRSEEGGDVLIRGLWAWGTACIIDVRVTDTDAESCISKDPMKAREGEEEEEVSPILPGPMSTLHSIRDLSWKNADLRATTNDEQHEWPTPLLPH